MRLAISPSPRTIPLPTGYKFAPGKGTVLQDGRDAVLFAYGPVMLNEALIAAETLKQNDVSLKVVNLPWLNRVDIPWLEDAVGDHDTIYTMDNHSEYGGLGDSLLNALMSSSKLAGKKLVKFAVCEYPACGTPPEVLAYHQLDGKSLAEKILKAIK